MFSETKEETVKTPVSKQSTKSMFHNPGIVLLLDINIAEVAAFVSSLTKFDIHRRTCGYKHERRKSGERI